MEQFVTEIIEAKLKITDSKCRHLQTAQEELISCTNVLDQRLAKIADASQEFGPEKEAAEKLKELHRRVQNADKLLSVSLEKLRAFEEKRRAQTQ